ncbi:hypothetical protein O181_125161 [Austropuccinia psidii MF-1]|uniref:Uncharacterized protein n=1 Tax=Austropuccinia psidii MF-1 TaxID=1389203 RepID=A0A9Q3KSK2_9BASI|nr:hypothetical protein [Austropuccinia psidii MF-1]
MGLRHVGEFFGTWAIFWSHGIPGSPAKLDPGGLQQPPWPMDHGVRTTDRNTPKDKHGQRWPYIKNFNKITQDPKKAKKAIKSIFIKNHHRKGQGEKYYV